MIFDRYLRREIFRPVLPTLAALAALFAGYSAASFLGDAAGGLLPADAVLTMVGLKVLISLEVLIPVALYVAVVVALGRLSSDSELVAAYALHVTPRRVFFAVFGVSATLAVAVGGLSLFARPWAYATLYAVNARAGGELEAGAMRPGTFYVGRNGERVVFFTRQDTPGGTAKDVFVQLWHGTRMEIIHAGQATQLTRDAADGTGRFFLRDAHIYQIDPARAGDDQALAAQDMVVDPDEAAGAAPGYSALSASTGQLLRAKGPAEVAELQWRLSTPLSTLLLGLLGIPMSRIGSRSRSSGRLGVAVLVYAAYYMLFTSARTWVQHGAVGTVPGVWWVPGLLGLVLLGALARPGQHVAFARA